MKKAANFTGGKNKKIGLQKITSNYEQNFSFSANIFPNKLFVSINGMVLKPGKDFIVSNESSDLVKQATLQKIDSTTFQSGSNLKLILKDELTWSVANEVSNSTTIIINKKI